MIAPPQRAVGGVSKIICASKLACRKCWRKTSMSCFTPTCTFGIPWFAPLHWSQPFLLADVISHQVTSWPKNTSVGCCGLHRDRCFDWAQKVMRIWLLLVSLALATLTCHWCPEHVRCPQVSVPLLLLLPLLASLSCHTCLVLSLGDCWELYALCPTIAHP